MDLKGTVKEIFPTKKVSEKFQCRQFVIETQEKYPQEIILQLSQEKCSLLDNIAEGELVQAFINVRGRAWTNPQGEVKYFNTLEVWKLSNESAQDFEPTQNITGVSKSKSMGNIESNFMEDAINTVAMDEDDDLPF